MTKVLGLTGGIASGKSTVSNFFKEHQIPVIDADVVSREVMQAGEPAVKEIQRVFGDEVIQENGEIDRSKLGAIVFESPSKRVALNEIVHGEIGRRIMDQLEALKKEGHKLVVMDIPLLYEAGYEGKVDEVMVVYVDKDTQKERLLKRNPGLSENDAINRIYSQMPLEDKAKRADVLINNQGTVKQTIKQVEQWLKTALEEVSKGE